MWDKFWKYKSYIYASRLTDGFFRIFTTSLMCVESIVLNVVWAQILNWTTLHILICYIIFIMYWNNFSLIKIVDLIFTIFRLWSRIHESEFSKNYDIERRGKILAIRYTILERFYATICILTLWDRHLNSVD